MRIAVATVFALSICAHAASAQVPNFRHVFVIVMENKESTEVLGNAQAPYLNSLAHQYGVATNAFGVAHPSLPNYMAMTSGDTFFTNDCVGCVTPAINLADRIEASGRTWTAYLEDMPSTCLATDSGLYVAKHNPFVHYSNIANNAARCNHSVVPFSRFSSDLAGSALADYVFIAPNLCNDMHDCSVAAGDAWLSIVVPQILQSAAFTDSVLFVTFDEGSSSINGGGRIPMIVASRWTSSAFQSVTPVNHYSLLRTIEDAWALPPLGQSANATAMSEFFSPAPAVPSEQVIYAADAKTAGTTWRKVPDVSAAAGVKLVTDDNGAAVTAGPQATPASYVDATFQASPGYRYRVWLRMRAQNDSKWNDSVFVQFSDSVDSLGRSIYRIGTTAGYIVNLAPCADCQSFGWGWQRNAYWLADSGDVWFPTGGSHTLRIQVREDGVQFDQIVISAGTYATGSPGLPSVDATIVPKPMPPSPLPPASTPFSGVPIAIPGTLRGSDFDNGPEGLAYHDTTPGNSGGVYRQTGVDLEPSSDGGYDIGWVAPGEWLQYTVNVASTGTYAAQFRIASPAQGGTFHLQIDGANVSGAIVVPATGGWQHWQTVTRTVTLPAGIRSARLVMDAAGAGGTIANINTVRFTSTSTSTPFGGSPVAIPGRIQAEQFDDGIEGIAYHDVSAGNSGGVYRSTDVDLQPTAGGYNVGWVLPGEWLNYTVTVAAPGTYVLNVRVSCLGLGGTFHLEMNGSDVSGSLIVPNTNGWQNWQVVSKTVTLQAGTQVARLVMDSRAATDVGNFDWFELTASP